MISNWCEIWGNSCKRRFSDKIAIKFWPVALNASPQISTTAAACCAAVELGELKSLTTADCFATAPAVETPAQVVETPAPVVAPVVETASANAPTTDSNASAEDILAMIRNRQS